ncbi:MAG: hypothetical protein ACXQTI_06610 [Candidatus Nezhaarchaeales archaeon]
MSLELVKDQLMYIGALRVSKEGRGFKLYLPKSLNDLWTKLHGRKVQVYIRVIEQQ